MMLLGCGLSLHTNSQASGLQQATVIVTTSGAAVFPPCTQSAATPTSTVKPSLTATPSATFTATPSGATILPVGAPFLGIQFTNVADCGVVILNVLKPSPAATAGLQAGDVIVAVDCIALASTSDSTLIQSLPGQAGKANTSATPGAGGKSATGLTDCSSVSPTQSTPVATITGSAVVVPHRVSLVFLTMIETRHPGDVVLLTLQRNGQELNIQV